MTAKILQVYRDKNNALWRGRSNPFIYFYKIPTASLFGKGPTVKKIKKCQNTKEAKIIVGI